MSFLLMLRYLLSRKLRTFMTLGSVTLAVLLVCLLQAIVQGLGSATAAAAKDRLWVQSAVSLFVDMPLSYESKIRSIDGIDAICKYQWFGGEYGDGKEQRFAQFAIDPETFEDAFPEIVIEAGSYEAFAKNRVGCLVGTQLAQRFDWQVGDSVPLLGKIFSRNDGKTWDFTIEAIYSSKTTAQDETTMFFHFDYLRESIESGAAFGAPGVGVYLLDLSPGAQPEAVMAAVDKLFENGPQRVQTTTEDEFGRQFVSMLGGVPLLLQSIGAAVVFAIFFAILNTMLMAARERTHDVGILKALGFTDRFVFLGLTLESVLLCLAGGLLGVAAALGMADGLARGLAGLIPGLTIGRETIALGLGLSLGLGLLAGIVPAWTASRLEPVTALRSES
jgi:putative ABC transport system permease protein